MARATLREYDRIGFKEKEQGQECCVSGNGENENDQQRKILFVCERDYQWLRSQVKRDEAALRRRQTQWGKPAERWRLDYDGDSHVEYIKLGSYVGTFELPSGMQIEVLPKIRLAKQEEEERKRLWEVLRYLPELNPFNSRRQTLRMSNVEGDFLLDQFFAAYVSEVECLVKSGLRSEYILQESNLPFYKGRLMVDAHLKNNIAHKERFYVEHDEFSLNSPANQLLRSALEQTLRKARRADTKKLARTLLARFEDVDSAKDPRAIVQRLVKDRNSHGYSVALDMAQMILFGSDYGGRRDLESLILLFDMNRVFESYVAKQLVKYVNNPNKDAADEGDNHYEVSLQEVISLEAGNVPMFKRIPDIVLKSVNDDVGKPRPLAVLDTKWKELNDDSEHRYGIKQEDVTQMLQYAALLGVERTVLIYPHIEASSKWDGIVFRQNNPLYPNLKLRIASWDMGFDEAAGKSAEKVFKAAIELQDSQI